MLRRAIGVCVFLAATGVSLGGIAGRAVGVRGDGSRPRSDAWHEAVVVLVALDPKGAVVGSGFVLGDGTWLVTAAHLLIREEEEGEHESMCVPTVYSHALGDMAYACVAAMDRESDLAILYVPWPGHPALKLATDAQIRSAEGALAGAWPTPPETKMDAQTRLVETPLHVEAMQPKQGEPTAIAFQPNEKVGDGWSGAPLIAEAEDAALGVLIGEARIKPRKEDEPSGGYVFGRAAGLIQALSRRAESKGAVTSLMKVKPFLERDDSAEAFAHAVAAAAAKGQKQWEVAFSEAESFVRLRPESAGAHVALAYAASKLGKHEIAKEHYQRALELEPRNGHVHFSYAGFVDETGEKEEALAEARRAVELLPEMIWAAGLLSDLLEKRGQSEEAEKVARRALELEPRNGILWTSLCNTLMSQEKYREAAEAARKAVELLPRIPELRMLLGYALRRAGDLDEAEKAYRDALGMRPSDPMVCFALGEFLARHRPEKLEEALTLVNNAIALNTEGKIPAEVLQSVRQDLEKRIGSQAQPGQ